MKRKKRKRYKVEYKINDDESGIRFFTTLAKAKKFKSKYNKSILKVSVPSFLYIWEHYERD